jgi:rubrerythrin
MAKKHYDPKQLEELLLQALQTELGGIEIYSAAIDCAQDDDLRQEWLDYLEETRTHLEIVTNVCTDFGIDMEKITPGREVVAHLGSSLVQAISMAKKKGTPEAAQIVAAECVVLAETKDHQNWELIGKIVEASTGETSRTLKQAYAAIEKQEDHHLYHTKGWCRELWIQSLGLPAVLPPPEEVKQVETAIGAARAEQARKDML